MITSNVSKPMECRRSSFRNGKNRNEIDECSAQCNLPCSEETFDIHESFMSMETVQKVLRKSIIPYIKVNFAYKTLDETHIIEVPSYDGKTLLANFGGTLGLMCGMSALSLIEIMYWLVLIIVEKLHRVYKFVLVRSLHQNSIV